MEQINKIFMVLFYANLVHDQEEFSQVYCQRHKKWMKDMNYTKATPCLDVLVNIKRTLHNLLVFTNRINVQNAGRSKDICATLKSCLQLVDQAMELHHANARHTLAEMTYG